MKISELDWDDASTSTYSAESTLVNGYRVVVCLDDEGPLRPAFFWTVESFGGERLDEGWAAPVSLARKRAVIAALAMEEGS